MMNEIKEPRTLQEAIVYFSNPDNSFNYMVAHRWRDGVIPCPVCGRTDATFLKNQRKWQCRSHHSFRQFSVKTGTIFEDSPLPLDKWLTAAWMLTNCKNGVSSWEIHRAIGVTQKTAWFMMHRIRTAMHTGSFMVKFGGGGKEVEVDETFIGGKACNMHKSVKARRITGQGHNVDDKVIVMGVLERGHGKKKEKTASQVRTMIIENRQQKTLHPIVKENVEAGSALYSDELWGYAGLDGEFDHQVIDHAVEYVKGKIHTNGMENYWSLFKRCLGGTYVSVEPFHLFRYMDEQEFRYNHRGTRKFPVNDNQRFQIIASQFAGKRLTYKELTGKTAEEQTPF
jgi:transposase-like protein